MITMVLNPVNGVNFGQCLFLCFCLLLMQSKGRQTCSCSSEDDGGCDSNQDCDPQGNCNKENVAYGKPATISSRYSGSGPACVAVNGRTGHTYVSLPKNTNCVHSGRDDRKAWWEVDLEENYTISTITVYNRKDYQTRVASIWIYVDKELCFQIPNDPSLADYGNIFTVTCNKTLRGRIVRFSKDGVFDNDNTFINFCEVQIWVCKAGRYGADCSQQCSGHCQKNDTCDNYFGTCPGACSDGYYDAKCSSPCGRCKDEARCDQKTGHCANGCTAGYQLPLCQAECANRTYGENCTSVCGMCEGNATCDIVEGACTACELDYLPPLCKELKQSPPGVPGSVIGGVVAAILLVVVLAAVGFLLHRRRKTNKARETCMPISNRLQTDSSNPDEPFEGIDSPVFEVELADRPAKPLVAVTPFCRQPATAAPAPPIDTRFVNPSPPHHPVVASSAPVSEMHGTPQAADTQHPQPQDIRTSRECQEESSLADMDLVYVNEDDARNSCYVNSSVLDPVQSYLVGRLASGELEGEYKTIPRKDDSEPQEVAKLNPNANKNRFGQILPYDRNRVVLKDQYSENTATDFINASYVTGFMSEEMYIATQGPKEDTVADFWRMVWQERITHIVMVTNIIDRGKSKCHQYWPEESSSDTYGPVTVTATGTQRRDNFYIRTFTIRRDRRPHTREVTQYHYVSWPDHGVPTTVSLVRFWRFVTNTSQYDPAPLLVHCSAGVGRTGTFIGLDIGMKTAVHGGCVNVLDLVKRMRKERMVLVQTVDQYVFLHEALLEAYTARDTVVPLGSFDTIFPQPITAHSHNPRIEAEFEAVAMMQPLTSELQCEESQRGENVNKIRNTNALPLDEHLVFLTEPVEGRNQYINAVFMPTFRDPKGSILTQLPLPSTLVDFWRLVYGNDVTAIVSLSSQNEEQEVTPYCQYWPMAHSEGLQCGPYTIDLQCKTEIIPVITSYTLSLVKQKGEVTRQVTLLHYEGWAGETGGDVSDMVKMLDTVVTSLADRKDPVLVIQCSDGVKKSGLFSALFDVINRLTYDQEINVYMAVRHVQSVSPHAVTSLEQYRYCYEVVQQWTEGMTVYANL